MYQPKLPRLVDLARLHGFAGRTLDAIRHEIDTLDEISATAREELARLHLQLWAPGEPVPPAIARERDHLHKVGQRVAVRRCNFKCHLANEQRKQA